MYGSDISSSAGLGWGAPVLCSKQSARREESFLHQVGHEAGFLVTAVVSFTILVI